MMPQILTAASFAYDDPTKGGGRGAAVVLPDSVPVGHALGRSRFARFGRGLDSLSLAILILAAGALMFRPSDLLPSLHRAPIYEALIAACLLTSIPRLLAIGATRSIRGNAIVALLMAMVPVVVLSHLAHGNTYDARLGGVDMLKACVFAMLVIALVDTTRRVHTMLLAVVTATLAVAGLSLLHYHGVLHVPALRAVEQANVGAADEPGSSVLRLCGIGVFNDPNDFSLLLVIGMVICGYAMCEGRGVIARSLMALPLGLFTYALLLTHSRGGFISLVTALLAYLHVRLGFRNALPVAILLFAGLLTVAWGRQTTFNLDNPEDTFQSRLELWNHALDIFRVSPIFGVGQGKIVDTLGYVVHNSYLQAFSETGFLGGTVFAGLFVTVLVGLWRARPSDEGLSRLRPCVAAIVASYAMGLMSLSRCYTVPTQLVIALGATYLSLGAHYGGLVLPRFDVRFVMRIVVASLAVLVGIYCIVRLLLHGAS